MSIDKNHPAVQDALQWRKEKCLTYNMATQRRHDAQARDILTRICHAFDSVEQAPPAALAVMQDLSERFSAMHAQGDVWITSLAAAKTVQAAMLAQQPAAAVPEGYVLVPVQSLRWWRELAEINPQDLVPRIDAMLAAANKENNNG